MDISDQLKRLQAMQANVLPACARAQKIATERAIEAAEEATPPEAGSGIRGTGTVTGDLKRAWREDSQTEPKINGGTCETELVNSMEYASFVDQGHRMDKHFVPGLYINPVSGLLERNTSGKGGIVVGTKTKYVQGFFMADKARQAYEKILPRALNAEIKKLK